MTPIPDLPLSPNLFGGLRKLQDEINSCATYEEQVALAKNKWDSKSEALFKPIKDKLVSMCWGNERCVYCEDSLADEIEHMRPKDLYPDQAYVWKNYVLACGPCNSPKGSKFSIINPQNQLIDVTRKPKAPIFPPIHGVYALIDPRCEDPLDFLWLDLKTFRYVPHCDDSFSKEYKRAEHTIEVLRLNTREALVRGRCNAFVNFRGQLFLWVRERATYSAAQQAEFIDQFRAARYRGVWERMKRYRKLPQLKTIDLLLSQAPEALAW